MLSFRRATAANGLTGWNARIKFSVFGGWVETVEVAAVVKEVEVAEAVLLLLPVVVGRSFVCHIRIVESPYTTIDSPFGERSELGS